MLPKQAVELLSRLVNTLFIKQLTQRVTADTLMQVRDDFFAKNVLEAGIHDQVWRQALEEVVRTCASTCAETINLGLIRLKQAKRAGKRCTTSDFTKNVNERLESFLNNIELIAKVLPDGRDACARSHSNIFNLALIELLETCYDQGKKINRDNVFLDRLAGFGEPQVVEQTFIDTVISMFLAHFEAYELPLHTFDGLYDNLSVLRVVRHKKDVKQQSDVLRALLSHKRFLDCPDANGETLLMMLLKQHQPGDYRMLLNATIIALRDGLRAVGRLLVQEQAYLSSVCGHQSVLTVAREKNLKEIYRYLAKSSPALALEALFFQCAEEERCPTFSEVERLLNHGLNPDQRVPCPPEKQRSIYEYFSEQIAKHAAGESDDMIPVQIKHAYSLIFLTKTLYEARRIETYRYEEVEYAGLSAQQAYLRQQLGDESKLDDSLRHQLSSWMLTGKVLSTLLGQKAAAKNQEQQALLFLLFANHGPFHEHFQHHQRHSRKSKTVLLYRMSTVRHAGRKPLFLRKQGGPKAGEGQPSVHGSSPSRAGFHATVDRGREEPASGAAPGPAVAFDQLPK